MAEKRKFTASVCVKIDAKTVAKIELSPASEWSKTAQGYRLRVNRKYHNGPGGGMLFLQPGEVGEFVAAHACGSDLPELPQAPALPPAPDLPRKTRVSVPNGRTLAGEAQYDGSRTETDPLLAHDGLWYVNVVTPTLGSVMVPVDTLIIHRGR